MADSPSFTKLVPGFDFLQGLVKNAGAAMPHMGQWVAPTLDPAELEKRIDELKTVQFWLEQNARLLGATIQALEVQRMTLSTLKTMNVQFGDLREAMKIRMPSVTPEVTETAPTPAEETAAATPEAGAVKPGVVDPMQWWGALTKQFTELASAAMKTAAAKDASGSEGAAAPTTVKTMAPAAGAAPRKAAAKPKSAARKRPAVPRP